MNTSLLKLSPLLLASMALTAHATPIIGQINITAFDVVLTPNQLGAVTSVGGSTDGLVSSVSGGTTSYPTTLENSANLVIYAPFNVVVGAQAVNPLWSVNDLANGFGCTKFPESEHLRDWKFAFNQPPRHRADSRALVVRHHFSQWTTDQRRLFVPIEQ
jgi:hypothetical protein